MKKLVTSKLNDTYPDPQTNPDLSAPEAFETSLSLHLVLSTWCGENWRWYIAFLEDALQDKTRDALSITLDSTNPLQAPTYYPEMQYTQSPVEAEFPSLATKSDPFKFTRLRSTVRGLSRLKSQKGPILPLTTQDDCLNGRVEGRRHFTFSDMQRVHFIEEKANETMLVLRANMAVLSELQQNYKLMLSSEDCPTDIVEKSKRSYDSFVKVVTSVIRDLRSQESRVENLLRLLADRKTLVSHKPHYPIRPR